ncbi:MAG: GH32 C-terminal domain-containing protein [Chitinophagales bacterium]
MGYDKANHRLYVDRARSGNAKGMNQDRLLQTIDLPHAGDNIRLDILFDKSSLEFFVNDGEKVLSTYIFPGAGAHAISAFSTGGNAIFKTIKIWDLSTP